MEDEKQPNFLMRLLKSPLAWLAAAVTAVAAFFFSDTGREWAQSIFPSESPEKKNPPAQETGESRAAGSTETSTSRTTGRSSSQPAVGSPEWMEEMKLLPFETYVPPPEQPRDNSKLKVENGEILLVRHESFFLKRPPSQYDFDIASNEADRKYALVTVEDKRANSEFKEGKLFGAWDAEKKQINLINMDLGWGTEIPVSGMLNVDPSSGYRVRLTDEGMQQLPGILDEVSEKIAQGPVKLHYDRGTGFTLPYSSGHYHVTGKLEKGFTATSLGDQPIHHLRFSVGNGGHLQLPDGKGDWRDASVSEMRKLVTEARDNEIKQPMIITSDKVTHFHAGRKSVFTGQLDSAENKLTITHLEPQYEKPIPINPISVPLEKNANGDLVLAPNQVEQFTKIIEEKSLLQKAHPEMKHITSTPLPDGKFQLWLNYEDKNSPLNCKWDVPGDTSYTHKRIGFVLTPSADTKTADIEEMILESNKEDRYISYKTNDWVSEIQHDEAHLPFKATIPIAGRYGNEIDAYSEESFAGLKQAIKDGYAEIKKQHPEISPEDLETLNKTVAALLAPEKQRKKDLQKEFREAIKPTIKNGKIIQDDKITPLLNRTPEYAQDEELMREMFIAVIERGKFDGEATKPIMRALELNPGLIDINIDKYYKYKSTSKHILHTAARYHDKALVSFILDQFTEVENKLDGNGETLLQAAIDSDDYNFVKLIMDRCPGCEKLHSEDKYGGTSLHTVVQSYLAEKQRIPFIKVLLDKSPELATTPNKPGHSPAYYINSWSNTDAKQQALQLLKEAEERVGKNNKQQPNPMPEPDKGASLTPQPSPQASPELVAAHKQFELTKHLPLARDHLTLPPKPAAAEGKMIT